MGIRFYTKIGTAPSAIEYGAELPTIPPTDGMVHTGWVNYFGAPVTSSAYPGYTPTYIAVWEEAPATVDYTITYQTEYGTAPLAKTVTAPYGEGYTLTLDDLPALTAEGYAFNGWTANGTAVSVGDTISADTTLVAAWRAATVDYTISYQTDHGTAPSAKTVTVNYGENYALTEDDLPIIIVVGYAFNGWLFADGSFASVGDTISANTVLTASLEEVVVAQHLDLHVPVGDTWVKKDLYNITVETGESTERYLFNGREFPALPEKAAAYEYSSMGDEYIGDQYYGTLLQYTTNKPHVGNDGKTLWFTYYSDSITYFYNPSFDKWFLQSERVNAQGSLRIHASTFVWANYELTFGDVTYPASDPVPAHIDYEVWKKKQVKEAYQEQEGAWVKIAPSE